MQIKKQKILVSKPLYFQIFVLPVMFDECGTIQQSLFLARITWNNTGWANCKFLHVKPADMHNERWFLKREKLYYNPSIYLVFETCEKNVSRVSRQLKAIQFWFFSIVRRNR
jgi:hypothetical protein